MKDNEFTETFDISQDSKNIAILLWIGTIFFGFIPGFICYLIKADDHYVLEQSKESLNWSITAIIAYFIASVLTLVVIGAFLIPAIGICHLIFCIMGALETSKGAAFKVPFALRFIK